MYKFTEDKEKKKDEEDEEKKNMKNKSLNGYTYTVVETRAGYYCILQRSASLSHLKEKKRTKKRGRKRKGGKKEKREKKTDAIIRNSVRASRPGIPFRRLSFTSASALRTNRLAEALAGANNQRSFCNN